MHIHPITGEVLVIMCHVIGEHFRQQVQGMDTYIVIQVLVPVLHTVCIIVHLLGALMEATLAEVITADLLEAGTVLEVTSEEEDERFLDII